MTAPAPQSSVLARAWQWLMAKPTTIPRLVFFLIGVGAFFLGAKVG